MYDAFVAFSCHQNNYVLIVLAVSGQVQRETSAGNGGNPEWRKCEKHRGVCYRGCCSRLFFECCTRIECISWGIFAPKRTGRVLEEVEGVEIEYTV